MEIQELNIRVPGTSPEQGTSLAQQVADRIAATMPPHTTHHYIPEIKIQWNGAIPQDAEALSHGIAEQIIRQIGLLTLAK